MKFADKCGTADDRPALATGIVMRRVGVEPFVEGNYEG